MRELIKQILREQSTEVINIDTEEKIMKLDDYVSKYCKKEYIKKPVIENALKDITGIVEGSLETFIDRVIPKDNTSYISSGFFNDLKTKMTTNIVVIVTKLLYRKYGYNSSYSPDADIKKLIDEVYNLLNENLNTVKNRTLLNVFVTKDNVGEIKKNILKIFNDASGVIVRTVWYSLSQLNNKIVTNFKSSIGKCESILVKVKSPYINLPKEKWYHPDNTYYQNSNPEYGDVINGYINSYATKVNKMIDGFA
jgi:rRNA processing protein Gar1